MRISGCISDVCSSDLIEELVHALAGFDPAVVAPALGGAIGNIERPASRLSELGAPVLTDRPHFLFVCHRSFPWLDEGELLCAGDALEALGEGVSGFAGGAGASTEEQPTELQSLKHT